MPTGENAMEQSTNRPLPKFRRIVTGHDAIDARPIPVPKAGYYDPGKGWFIDKPSAFEISKNFDRVDDAVAGAERSVVPIIFYRSMLLAADVAPIDALAEALRNQGITAVPIFVSSLKDAESLAFVEKAFAALKPAAIVTATAFASSADPGAETLFDRAGVPVFQVIVATTRRDRKASTSAPSSSADGRSSPTYTIVLKCPASSMAECESPVPTAT